MQYKHVASALLVGSLLALLLTNVAQPINWGETWVSLLQCLLYCTEINGNTRGGVAKMSCVAIIDVLIELILALNAGGNLTNYSTTYLVNQLTKIAKEAPP